MSNPYPRFIELNSAYRNRNEDPLEGQFTILISQTGSKNRLEALDPVSNSAVEIQFSPNETDAGGGTSITATIASTAITTPAIVIVTVPTGDGQHVDNYYAGLVANNTTATQRRRIVSWTYLYTAGGTDFFQMGLDTGYGDGFAIGDSITIANSTVLTDTSHPIIFVPTGEPITDYYIGQILYNDTVNAGITITNYDYNTHILYFDLSTPIVGWALTDQYSIRKTIPSEYGALLAGTTTTFTLPATSNSVDDFYKNSFIRITSGANIFVNRKIVAYNGTTKVGTVYPAFSTALAVGITYQILYYCFDNAQPFVYTVPKSSQMEPTCYEVSLVNLTLPNKILGVPRGSRIVYYPYVYVELENLDVKCRAQNILPSNNPNASKALFISPCTDTSNQLVTSFLKIDSGGAVQCIKLMPNDSFRLTIRLPNGEIFQTKIDDDLGPLPANPLLQISALFSFKKV